MAEVTEASISQGDGRYKRTKSLADPEWAAQLLSDPNNTIIVNGSDLVLGQSPVSEDHMFTAFLQHDLLEDLVCLYNASTKEVFTMYHLGTNTCGHPGIVHGGLTSAIIDETFGALMYMLKSNAVLEEGPAFTANLTVDYRAPIPAGIVVMCRCWLESTERRKIWLRAEVRDQPEGTLFAEGRALFINARKESEAHRMATSTGGAGNSGSSLEKKNSQKQVEVNEAPEAGSDAAAAASAPGA